MRVIRNQNNHQKAFRYFTMGLTAKEIGKLLDLSQRTIEGYITRGEWKRPTDDCTIIEKALSLVDSGKSYLETSKILGVSKKYSL
jgi:hypothetical protein